MVVISRKQAAERADVSERTLDRLYIAGLGPPRIQITRRRCGYDLEAFERWLSSRAFSSQAAAVAASATLAVPSTTPGRYSTPSLPPAPQATASTRQAAERTLIARHRKPKQSAKRVKARSHPHKATNG